MASRPSKFVSIHCMIHRGRTARSPQEGTKSKLDLCTILRPFCAHSAPSSQMFNVRTGSVDVSSFRLIHECARLVMSCLSG